MFQEFLIVPKLIACLWVLNANRQAFSTTFYCMCEVSVVQVLISKPGDLILVLQNWDKDLVIHNTHNPNQILLFWGISKVKIK